MECQSSVNRGVMEYRSSVKKIIYFLSISDKLLLLLLIEVCLKYTDPKKFNIT